MGGEGHVFDMIQRAKQNRKMIQDRRDRMKDLVEKMNEKPLTGYPNKLAEGEMALTRSHAKRSGILSSAGHV